jgi:hypothetical protein
VMERPENSPDKKPVNFRVVLMGGDSESILVTCKDAGLPLR